MSSLRPIASLFLTIGLFAAEEPKNLSKFPMRQPAKLISRFEVEVGGGTTISGRVDGQGNISGRGRQTAGIAHRRSVETEDKELLIETYLGGVGGALVAFAAGTDHEPTPTTPISSDPGETVYFVGKKKLERFMDSHGRIYTFKVLQSRQLPPALTIERLIGFIAAGFSEDLIIAEIRRSSRFSIPTTTEGINTLTENRCSQRVIAAMVEKVGLGVAK